MENLKTIRRFRIRKSIRKRIHGTALIPRLTVYKSNTAIYGQLIDDQKGVTIIAVSSKNLALPKGINVVVATKVGEALAQKALDKGINQIVFDRSGYLYHGRIKALADGARAKGLKF